MFFFESQRREIVLKVFKVELSLSSFVDGSQQTSHFFLCYFSAKLSDVLDYIFPSDELSIATDGTEDILGIKIERAQ